ncbi:MAG: EAL domain-containing protein [Chromatiales bacterium]|nr:EAL domain-containing protein [Chromatiales bacterium]
MHELLKKQLELAGDNEAGDLHVAELLRLVSRSYSKLSHPMPGAGQSGVFRAPSAESSLASLILDHVKDAILTVDSWGLIESINPTCERLFGYRSEEVVGRSLDLLLPSPGQRKWVEYLETLAAPLGDTHADLAAHEGQARHRNGGEFPVELAVSASQFRARDIYVVCVRDATERKHAERALRESEARNKTLVDHAPEAIVVFDVDSERFADVNENAVRLFGMSREELLAAGPREISPRHQPDGTLSFGMARGYIAAALNGEFPVFEWHHIGAGGHEIPCEVRLARLPSSNRRLVRGSVTDISERKRAELRADIEKEILELIAENVALSRILDHLNLGFEKAYPGARCSVYLVDDDKRCLRLMSAPSLPQSLAQYLDGSLIGADGSDCGRAIFYGHQSITQNIPESAAWGDLGELAERHQLKACCSTPIVASSQAVLGSFAVYHGESREPSSCEHDLIERMTRLAAIAIERSRAEEAMRESEARYRSLFETVVDGVYQTCADGHLISANPALVQMLGYGSEEEFRAVVNLSSLYANPEDRLTLFDRLRRNGSVRNFEYRLRCKDGREIVVIENARAVYDENGKVSSYEGTITDITERKRAEMAVFEQKERAQVTLQSIADAVITCDADGRVDYMNPAAETLLDWELRRASGAAVDTIFAMHSRLTGQVLENPVLRCLREGRSLGLSDNSVIVNRHEQQLSVHENVSPIRDREGAIVGAVMVFRDMCQDGRLRRQLSYQASHDELTGLINRRQFENFIDDALIDSRGDRDSSHVLLYLDLDQFKVVNDLCGHSAGDQLLKRITGVLHGGVESTDAVARLGGDEFGILLKHCKLEKGMRVAEQLCEAVRALRFNWQERAINVSASIGMVAIDSNSETSSNVLSAADVACYAAKEAGRNRVHVYQSSDSDAHHREMLWVSQLTSAIERDRLELFFQPIVPVDTDAGFGGHYELLLRMRGEDGQLIQPSAFIPAAERYNMMPTLDRWVIEQALTLADRSRNGSGEAGYTLAVNLSGTSLSDASFLEDVARQIAAEHLPPHALCFEITETAAIANLGNVARFMHELKSMGCQFALDDFGSGLSSFAYLKNLPVDYLKIDGHFVANVHTDNVDRRMLEAISQVAEALGIRTVAERVETRAILNELSDIGVDFAQGFYIARPEPVKDFDRFSRRLRRSSLRLA